MARPDRNPEIPPCYAVVHPGLEEVAGEEIVAELGGDIKKTGSSVVVFRVDEIDASLLKLRTVEDVFVYAWGTDQLSYRSNDLDSIRKWTAKGPDWNRLLQIHHAIRPKPKGKPTIRLVVQMSGEHGYRRVDARKALAEGLAGKLPSSWRYAEENASIEVWLTIHGAMAVCGIRLSDATMRHRTYKVEHIPASLRPTVAACMVRLADLKPGNTLLDPFCGAGTLLAESMLLVQGRRLHDGSPWKLHVLGGDLDPHHLRFTQSNLFHIGEAELKAWDARRLPLPDACVDRVITNPPFGKQISTPEEIVPLYREMVREIDRVLKPGGKAVILVSDAEALKGAVEILDWKTSRKLNLRILGQRATIFLFRKMK